MVPDDSDFRVPGWVFYNEGNDDLESVNLTVKDLSLYEPGDVDIMLEFQKEKSPIIISISDPELKSVAKDNTHSIKNAQNYLPLVDVSNFTDLVLPRTTELSPQMLLEEGLPIDLIEAIFPFAVTASQNEAPKQVEEVRVKRKSALRSKALSLKRTSSKRSSSKRSNSKLSNCKSPNLKSCDSKLAEPKSPDSELSESNSLEPKSSDLKLPETESLDSESPDSDSPETKSISSKSSKSKPLSLKPTRPRFRPDGQKRYFGPCLCSMTKGPMKCSLFPDKRMREIRAQFDRLSAKDQVKLVQNLVFKDTPKRARDRKNPDVSRRSFTFEYYLLHKGRKIRVCKKTFFNTFQIGEWRLRNWLLGPPGSKEYDD